MNLERTKWEKARPVSSLDQLEIQKDMMRLWASDNTTGKLVMHVRSI